jgi:hypothetical protein
LTYIKEAGELISVREKSCAPRAKSPARCQILTRQIVGRGGERSVAAAAKTRAARTGNSLAS